MRAITIQQPWAFALAFDHKDVENRGLPHPWHSAIGETLGIHAGKTWDEDAIYDLRIQSMLHKVFKNPDPLDRVHTWQAHLDRVVLPYLRLFDGRLLSARRLLDVHDFSHCPQTTAGGSWSSRRCSEWAEDHQWHLVFERSQVVFEPTPVRGYQGLWTLPLDLTEIPRVTLAGAS